MAAPPAGQRSARRRLLRVVAHNVNGVRALSKRRALFDGLARGAWDVVVLSETHTAADDDVEAWLAAARGAGRPWEGRAFWAHGQRGSRGVAILLGGHICSDTDVDTTFIEFSNADAVAAGGDGGRVLRVGWRDAPTGASWSVVAVYAPNDEAARRAFFAPGGPLSRAPPTRASWSPATSTASWTPPTARRRRPRRRPPPGRRRPSGASLRARA